MLTLQNYIGGQWSDSAAGKRGRVINPANRELLCEAPASEPEDAERALVAAEKSFQEWSRTPMPKRAELLQRLLQGMREREADLARTITRENGKPLREAQGEVQSAIKEVDFQIGQGRRFGGQTAPSEVPGVICYLARQPLGVVSLITPWNFPLNVACRKMVPALLAGNCCVLKPAELTPMTAALLFECLHAAGFPAGIANLLIGRGPVIGDTLMSHRSVRGISFTGSTEVGIGIARRVAGSAVKVQLEMGGKNPLVVLADADLERAVDAALLGGFACAGQWCTSTSRVIVETPIYERFVAALSAGVKSITVGDGFDESIRMGPVCGARQFETILESIEIAKREGAKLCAGGHALTDSPCARGWFIAPTLFSDVTPEMQIAQEEIFGPVLAVMRANDFEDALRLANGVRYGLASSIYTSDLAKAQRFIAESEAGLCHVNMPTSWKEPQLEFGGIKESGRGAPEAGSSGIEFFTHHKAVYVKERA